MIIAYWESYVFTESNGEYSTITPGHYQGGEVCFDEIDGDFDYFTLIYVGY